MQSVVEDHILETMTQQLLQISSVFLVQQSELHGVKERLNKELTRVSLIQDALTLAAQQHQDAVRHRRRCMHLLRVERLTRVCACRCWPSSKTTRISPAR